MLGSLRASPPYDSDNKGKLILSAELLSLAARRGMEHNPQSRNMPGDGPLTFDL